MSASDSYRLWLPFRSLVSATVADEMTIGAVWNAAVVEGLTLDVPLFVSVRAWAVSSRLPRRTGLALNLEEPRGQLLTAVASDVEVVRERTGVTRVVDLGKEVAIGVVVPWAPWYLVIRVENSTAAAVDAAGQFRVSVLDRGDLWGELAAGQRLFEFGREGRWREEVSVGVGSPGVGQRVVAWR